MTTQAAPVTVSCDRPASTRPALALTLLLFALAAPVHADQQLFSAPFLGFDTGSASRSIAISDLNADGRLDLVTANAASASISVLLGNAAGTFGPKTDFGTGLDPNSVAIADLNADGRPDVVTANADSNANTVSVLLGNGDGTFGRKTDFGTGSTPGSVAIADLNGDGRPDVVTANIGYHGADNTVSVLLGIGDGTFGPRTEYDAGAGLTCTVVVDRSGSYVSCPGYFLSVAITDLDADGRVDVAVVNSNSNRVSVLLGNGDGTLRSMTDFVTGGTPSSVAIGDLNADGTPDLAVTNYSSSTVSVLPGLGNGLFGGKTDFATGASPLSVAIGALDADGRLDLAVVEAAHTVSVLVANGNTFRPRSTFHTGANPYSVAIADLDADGRPDLAVAGGPTSSGLRGSVSVLRGNGDGTFGTNAEFATGISPLSVAASDLNADGRADLVVANSVSATVSVLLGNGNGTFGPRTDYSTRTNLGSGANSVGISDLNGDGRLDLVVADEDRATNLVLVLLGNGDGTFGQKTGYGTGVNPAALAIADLNADGRPDVVTADNEPSQMSVLLGNGNGGFDSRTDYATGSEPQSVAIADLNADGRPDAVTADDGPGVNKVSVFLGKGDGTFLPKRDFATGSRPDCVAIVDLNADGRPDIVTANSGFGIGSTVSVLPGNGDGTFGPGTEFGVGAYPVAVAIGDLDGDGRSDLAVANRSSNTVSVLRGRGDGTFGPKTDFGTGNIPYSLAIADFNGDGRPDLAVTNADLNVANTVSVLLNTGDHVTATLQAQFDATPGSDGITLAWSFGEPSRVASSTVERAPNASGPWASITPELRHDGDVTVALDRATDSGRTYFYRLDVRLVDGSSITFGPIASTRNASIGESAVNVLAPNPAHTVSRIQYSVARAGHVRLEVTDVVGRVVMTLIDGVQLSGRFQIAWDGTNRGARLPAGLYFVRLTAPDRTVASRITRLP